jgi:hypothetical protein
MTVWPMLVDRDEAAHALRTTPEVLDRLVAAGRLPAVRIAPEEPARFRPEDLAQLVDDSVDDRGGMA